MAAARGLGDFVNSLAAAIQQYEGWFPPGAQFPQGSLSYRNNNPGNLRPGSLAVGATGVNGGYAVFPDYQTGWNALVGLIQSNQYYGDTLTQFFQTYAPAADNNNPAAYAAGVAAQLGVDANTPISQLEAGEAVPSSSGDDDSGDDSGDGSAQAATLAAPSAPSGSTAPLSDTISDAFGSVPGWAWGLLGGLLALGLIL